LRYRDQDHQRHRLGYREEDAGPLAFSMCNLYSVTTNQTAIIVLFRVVNRYVVNLPPMPGVLTPASIRSSSCEPLHIR
jgi:hypothetical protein